MNDPEMHGHLEGFVSYVLSKDGPQMTGAKYHTMRHIQRVQQQVSLSIAQTELDALSRWGLEANAIFFFPNGNVRDAHGRVLVSADGTGPEPGADVPHPKEGLARKAKFDAFLGARGIRLLPSLPPVISESEVTLRSPAAVVGRAYALLAVALRAESLAGGSDISAEELTARLPLALEHFTPRERDFFDDPRPAQVDLAQFAWLYECVFLFEWALGLVPELPFPLSIYDVPLTSRTLFESDPAALLKTARLKPCADILDALDLHFRLHWAIAQARSENKAGAEEMDAGVVFERHKALNWLVRFENAEWDAVDTPT